MPDGDEIDCTVGILTFNSVATLGRTLDATGDFSTRIICDGGSTDGTVELARSHGCLVIVQDPQFRRDDGSLRDFAGAMRQLLAECTTTWFFKVDSDEIPSAELVDELRHTLLSDCAKDGFTVPLKYVVKGRVIADASTYPMHQLRLLRMGVGLTYSGHVHEHIDTAGRAIGALQHPQLLPQPTITTLIPRWWRYLRIELDDARQVPRRLRWQLRARRHFVIARYLAWRYTKVLRSGRTPRLPIRYEALRVTNHLVAVVLLLAVRPGVE